MGLGGGVSACRSLTNVLNPAFPVCAPSLPPRHLPKPPPSLPRYLPTEQPNNQTALRSWIIYLSDPDEPWTAEDGGALELFPLVDGEGGGREMGVGGGGLNCEPIP